MGTYRYHYSKLCETHKEIYRSLYNGMMGMDNNIPIPPCDQYILNDIYNKVLWDNVEIFYTNGCQLEICGFIKEQYTVRPKYIYSCSEVSKMRKDIDSFLKRFHNIKGLKIFEQELYVHDYFLKNYKYFDNGISSHNVIDLIYNNHAVCDGFAKGIKLIFDYLDIPSLLVTGKLIKNDGTSEGHTWNIIKIDKSYYHFDVTLDITLKNKALRYDYFNIPDSEIERDHIFANDLPKCVENKYEYFTYNNLVAKGQEDFRIIFLREVKKHNNICFRVLYNSNIEKIQNKILEIIKQEFTKSTCYSTNRLYLSCNRNRCVFEINLN